MDTKTNIRNSLSIITITLFFLLILINKNLACAAPISITIHPNNIKIPVNSRLLGTNAPMWVTRQQYTNEAFIAQTKSSGLGIIRIPGGNRSNEYDWLSCENNSFCVEKGWSPPSDFLAARPTDFINFLRKTGKEAIFTINVNSTPEEAAAVVAFFNATPENNTPIGYDHKKKIDWRTAGYWAKLRVDNGNKEPLNIKYWEIGNEIWSVETPSWTRDGAEYINGKEGYGGYKKIREKMRSIDSNILVGAVGYGYLDDPSKDWDRKVIQAMKGDNFIDFYVIHPYAFNDESNFNKNYWITILAQPRKVLPKLITSLKNAFKNPIHIAATEYNLISDKDKDKFQLLDKMGNALFIAETIGQMIENGYWAANQWILTGDCADQTNKESCFNLLDTDSHYRTPQYYVFPLWSHFGSNMLAVDVDSKNNQETQLSIYSGKIKDGTYSLLAINKTGNQLLTSINIENQTIKNGTVETLKPELPTLESKKVIFNGVGNPNNDLSNALPTAIDNPDLLKKYTFEPYSVTLLKLNTIDKNISINTNTANLINHYYEKILGRDPDQSGFQFWSEEITRMRALNTDIQEAFRVMAGQFFTSTEYLAKNTNDNQYVTDLYRTFFNRNPENSGFSYWLGQLNQGIPRSVVLFTFLFSPEFSNYMQGLLGNTTNRAEVYALVDFYRGFLNRLPDDNGFKNWIKRFRDAQCKGAPAINTEANSISAEFLGSPEYNGRNRTNSDYVADLYYAFLRRGGDLKGFKYWVDTLDNGSQNREQLRQAFRNSPEFKNRIEQIINQGCNTTNDL